MGVDAAIRSGELLAIPGVGPRNQRKLVEKGFDGVAQLKQLYRDKVIEEQPCGGALSTRSNSRSSSSQRSRAGDCGERVEQHEPAGGNRVEQHGSLGNSSDHKDDDNLSDPEEKAMRSPM